MLAIQDPLVNSNYFVCPSRANRMSTVLDEAILEDRPEVDLSVLGASLHSERPQPVVLSLDIGTSGVRAGLFDHRGDQVAGSQVLVANEFSGFAAVVLEQHGYPPLVLSFESIDELDHVIFVYRRGHRWGSVARSRDPGLHGRRPVFATARALAQSYVDPYIDFTGRITGYAVVDLRAMGNYDWRLAETNIWKVERMLLDYPHRRIASSDRRADYLRARYRAFRARYPGCKPLNYRGRETWTALPAEFNPSRNLAWVS